MNAVFEYIRSALSLLAARHFAVQERIRLYRGPWAMPLE
jgi:hypothetical protein